MTSHETPSNARPTTETGSSHGRRRFVQLSGAAIAVGLAGCSDFGIGTGDPDDEEPDDASGSEATTNDDQTETEEPTETDTEEPTEEPTETDEEGTETEGEETETDGDIHEHGNLYLEIDGERHEFTDSKYYEDGGASGVFHFHDDGNDYYWHMHDVRLTLSEALAELPDISYESSDGNHVVNFEGDTYEDGEDGTEVEISERDVAIDPEEYELQDGDVIWIEITTDGNVGA